MRIRKNAKISAFLYANENFANGVEEALLQNNLCQLNQSPWDIITFPSSDSSSSFHQFDDNEVYYDVNLAGNGSSVDSGGDFESMASKTSQEGEQDNGNEGNNEYDKILGFKEEIELCGEVDEKGWQCGRPKNGHKMCDRHLSKLQKYSVWTTKKKAGPIREPHHTKKRPTTNPHEYYYYSRFGPSWGKKRGATDAVSNAYNGDTNYETSGVNDDIDVQKENRQWVGPEGLEVGPMEVKLDYIDDDEKGKKVIIGKKKGRKQIKARSLKSLM